MPLNRVLIVDDEALMRRYLKEALTRKGLTVDVAETAKEALHFLKENIYDIMLSDVKLPNVSGIDLLRKAKELSPTLIVILMTAFGSVESAVEAMQLGAYHYLLKPFTPDALEALFKKAEEQHSLVKENILQHDEVLSKKGMTKVIAESPLMKKLLEEAKKVARSSASVLIHGESGTGKEVIAGAIHASSLRASRPYIRVNCAAIPDTLIESEFFGHEKGSFTGASAKKLGRFELAHGGTLLLDEVTEIPLLLQPKLLRVIQEQEFERIGGMKPVKVDVRLISTSNRNLKQAIQERVFREDLYFRLNVVPLQLPPLRERKEDILVLAKYFLDKFCKENGKKNKILSESAVKALLDYHWPGNIRQLANVLERVVVLDLGPELLAQDLYLE